MPHRLTVRDIAFFERPVAFVRPFRFGAVVINAAPQAFVRVEIEVEGKGVFTGASAEMLVPKWFDKRAHLTPEQTVDELRRSLLIARDLYLARSGFATAFELHTDCIAAQVEACAKEDIPPLAAAYGPAEIDKAILDALLRSAEANFFGGMIGNIAGIDASLSPDVQDGDIAQFLAARRPLARVAIRHTVGLDDTIEGEGGVADIRENSGARYFKLKLNGDPDADAARLIRIGRELATLDHDYRVSLDANEQYADLAGLGALIDRLEHDGALQPIAAKLLYVEQPMPRDITRASPLGKLAGRDFIIDEADDTLTCQAGLAVQQDLALGALIGVTHAERNGHHYVDGFADTAAAEAQAFLAAHPDLYEAKGSNVRLSIHDGDLLTGSLRAPGFAASVQPDWSALNPLEPTKARTKEQA
jgi:hypothetical protein